MKKQFTIDRSKWVCGGYDDNNPNKYGEGHPSMKNKFGFMCCLGHIQSQIDPNLSLDDICSKIINSPSSSPHLDNEKFLPLYPSAVYSIHIQKNKINIKDIDLSNNPLVNKESNLFVDTPLSTKAAKINDNEHINIKEREKQLKELFAQYDIELRFIGEPVKKNSINGY